MSQKFSKFFVASLKRVAQNVYPLTREREKLEKQIAQAHSDLDSINAQLEAYQAPIKELTGGYTTDDLITREVITTDKINKAGQPVRQTVYRLRYPDTVVPPAEEATTTGFSYPVEQDSELPEAEDTAASTTPTAPATPADSEFGWSRPA